MYGRPRARPNARPSKPKVAGLCRARPDGYRFRRTTGRIAGRDHFSSEEGAVLNLPARIVAYSIVLGAGRGVGISGCSHV